MSKRSLVIMGVVSLMLLLLIFTQFGVRPKLPGVKLVLFITVDQFADTYIDRFEERVSGGLKTILDRGVIYRKALHPHANTATCPGHASLSTGTFPSKHGIVNNYWYDREEKAGVYCVSDSRYEISPNLLRRSGLPDWINNTFSSSQVFSISGKDRAAVMMGGRHPDGVFWFDRKTGGFSTSRYYQRGGMPWWLEEFNESKSADRFYGESWVPLREGDPKSDSYDFDFGDFPHIFPHKLGNPGTAPDEAFYGDIYRSPFIDQLTIDLALELLSRFELGKGASPDYLSISLSALDTVGHRYGSFSREVEDVLLRLDQELERLLEAVEKEVRLENVVLVFSSDHGIPPFPEHHHKVGHDSEENSDAGRVTSEEIACLQSVYWKEEQLGEEGLFDATLYLKEEFLDEDGFPEEELSESIKNRLLQCTPIIEAYDSTEVSQYEVDGREHSYLASLKRNYYEGRSEDFFVVGKPYYSFAPTQGINHGSPHPYDSEVPIIFLHPQLSLSNESVEESLFVTDVAPTVAALIGVRAPRDIDGKTLPLEVQ